MILVAGEALVDRFPDGSARPGGSPYNVAIGLARLACPVALATQIGDDGEGRLLLGSLEREGVDTRFLRRSANPTPTATVELEAEGGASYRFTGLADLELGVEGPLGPETRGLHIGSFALVSPGSASALLDLFETAPRAVLRSVDPNVRLAMEPSVEKWSAAVAAFAARADLIKASEEDIRTLEGSDADPDRIAAGWLSGGCALVALTRGARGASLFTRRYGRIDAAPVPIEMVDTVGAGDAFQAALLAGLNRGESRLAPDEMPLERLRSVLEIAVRAGALACARPGADPPGLSQLVPDWA